MQTSLELLKKRIKTATAVMEILDARLPFSSANPYIDHICKNVVKIKVLNKNDLADPVVTEAWLAFFKNEAHAETVTINGKNRKECWRAANHCAENAGASRARKIRIMVIGIPNTGKSTIINSLAGRKIARTGNTPAVTRHSQRVPIDSKTELYDMPGVLWPAVEPERRANILAVSGAVSDSAIDYTDLGGFAADFLTENYPDRLKSRFGLDQIPDSSTALLEKIAGRRGFLKKGGRPDISKACNVLINEIQQGKLGRVSFEKPGEIPRDIYHE